MRRYLVIGCALAAGVTVWAASTRPVASEDVTVVSLPQQDLTLSLTGTASHPKMGLPDFTVAGGDPELQQAALATVEVLWSDLEFENDYYMIPRTASASVPAADSKDNLPYERWSALGANFVILGSVRRADAGFQIDLRVIGVGGRADKLVVHGAQYAGAGCGFKTPRACAHYISDDIHKKLRALDGVARTKLVFTSDRDAQRMAGRRLADSGPSKEIYISDYDGANQQRITANQSLNLGATWSPDGRSLAYTSFVTGFPDIYISNIFEGR